MRHSIKLFILF